jgi:hypothetical protein
MFMVKKQLENNHGMAVFCSDVDSSRLWVKLGVVYTYASCLTSGDRRKGNSLE